MSHLKGVLIDFGGTLAHFDEEDDRRFREEIDSLLADHGHQKTLDKVTEALYDGYRGSTKGEVRDLDEFWTIFLKNLNIPENPMLVRQLKRMQKDHAATNFQLYDGAISVLSVLRQKYRLALVSNCAIGLSDVVEGLGLTGFFDAVVLSYEVGVRKPDRRIYLEALRKLRLKPEECVFVADEISDLEGAREVGLKTLLVRQSDRTTDEARDLNFKPDFQCNSISEVTRFF